MGNPNRKNEAPNKDDQVQIFYPKHPESEYKPIVEDELDGKGFLKDNDY